ncbi:MerR family transcriptional regulator [Paenibacillus illinoisensis]|uniref:MerR family transcriptional regulator n=1 Tax=Paenibacillus illinoisensis TaxID=59845 RepID=UPI003018DBAA
MTGSNGRRQYSANDIAWIRFLVRLRTTGMTIRQMQQVADLRRQGGVQTADDLDDIQSAIFKR